MGLRATPKLPLKIRLFLLKRRRFPLPPLKQKGLSLLPNLFTLGNAFFGFSALVFVAREDFVAGAYAILLGSLMDMLDGRIARYAGTSSELGLQLDSLCDAVSFCVAPAFLMFFWQLQTLGILGFCACALFLLTGVLRLARFNITHDAQTVYFLGIPTTIAAISLIVLFLNFQHIIFTPAQLWLLLGLVTLLSILMVSKLKFPTLKHIKRRWYAFGILATLVFFMVFGCIKMGFIVICCYFLFALEENIRLAIARLK